jgi:Protein of unknown function (DUF2924)
VSIEIEKRLTLLPGMSKAQLLDLWNEMFKAHPPRQVRRELLIKILAYRLQEQAYGGLSSATRKQLHALARRFEANPNAELSGVPRIKPGTRLIREWRGQSHCVTVLENGYEYAGKHFSSLSRIARLITGTRWSGPLFFALRSGHVRGNADDERT